MEYFDNIQAMDFFDYIMIDGWWVTHESVKQLSGWLPGKPTKGTAGAYREGEITNAQGLCGAGDMACSLGDVSRGHHTGTNPQKVPSRELTYPTWGKGKSSSKVPFYGIC